MGEVTVQKISSKKHLEQVIALGDSNTQTLGFFPHEAFCASADNGCILTAINNSDDCVGYLLYYIAKERAVIVHLCIAESYRGKGITKKLVNQLVGCVKRLRGISLKCRKDYKENNLWPKLGFTPEYEKPGRAKKGSTLVSWWMELNNPSLFSYAASTIIKSKTPAVIDANVLFDLEKVTDDTKPSHALRVAWLDDIEFCLTTEIYNEIQRQTDPDIKKKRKSLAAQFHILPQGDRDQFIKLYTEIKAYRKNKKTWSESDESDMRHLYCLS